ncbi:MscS Mechanosensitive ion channel [Halodesulfurarchaeum formicicum]|uniref:MscS Mechanosensitive ion channel n=2 Tax=Halodesulfurarchaeum formicicum TaxID=1873524 RepID=A0A1J1AD33_9EURY|nr:MscS Mechanosensitive ion channel [Halodesulfurarchaeum formicicum]
MVLQTMAVISTLLTLLRRLLLALESLAVVIVVFGLVYLFGQYVVVPTVDYAFDSVTADETLKHTIHKVTGAAFLLLGFYLALPLSGLATTPTTVAAITAGGTIAVGFASREILSNFVSGVILVLDPEFRIGDWIRWGETEGVIEAIGFRVTRVHTFDNELITVPNSQLTTNQVWNPANKDRRRVTCRIGIDYDADIQTARDILRQVALTQESIEDRPAPTIHVVELAESDIGLQVLFWIADPERAEIVSIQSEYFEQAKAQLDAAGIDMPYPHRELTGSVDVRDRMDPHSSR